MVSPIRLATFREHYKADDYLRAIRAENENRSGTALPGVVAPVEELLQAIGGLSFNGGLYRTHVLEAVPDWNETIGNAWSETAGKVCCFGYDWEGRQFALHGESVVLQFSAGDLEMVEIPGGIDAFHNEILVNMAESALAVAFYQAWRDSGGAMPKHEECIGYKRPLFLGGTDWLDNLEVINMDVYWTVSASVIAQARRVGTGGRIGKIEFKD